MMPWSCRALMVLLLGATTGFCGWPGLGDTPEELRAPPGAGTPLEVGNPPEEKLLEQPVLDETLMSGGQDQVAQLMEDIMEGNVSSCGAAQLWDRHQVVPSDLHYVQERTRDVCSQRETDLDLLLLQQHRMEEVMEMLQQVNQSLELTLEAMEGARSWLDKHLQHVHDDLNLAGQRPSAISTCVLHGSFFMLLVALLVSMPPHVIVLLLLFLFLLLLLASSALSELLITPALFLLPALAMAVWWLLVAICHGAGGARIMLPREKPHHQLTSTPEREHELELLQEELGRLEMSCLQEPLCLEQTLEMARDLPGLAGWVSPVPSGWRTKMNSCRDILEPAVGTGKCWEPKPCSPSQSLANDMSLLSSRLPCQGLTRAGQRCRKKATPGQDFCHVHATG